MCDPVLADRSKPAHGEASEGLAGGPELGSQDGPEVVARIQQCLPLVTKYACSIARDVEGYIAYEDLVSAGREGLFRAAQRFEPAREVPFEVYARYRIRGAILDSVRRCSRLPRRLYAQLTSLQAASLVSEGEALFVFNQRAPLLSDAEAEQHLDEHLATIVTAATAATQAAFAAAAVTGDESEPTDPESAYAQAELLALIRTAIGDLDELEGKIVELMYFEGMSLQEVSKTLHIGKPWACRLHARAMDRLTRRLRTVA